MQIKHPYLDAPRGIRSLSYHELYNLPIDTFIWISGYYGLCIYKGPSKNVFLDPVPSVKSSYIHDKNNRSYIDLETDNLPVKEKGFVIKPIVSGTYLYLHSGMEEHIPWANVVNHCFLVNDSLLNNIISPFMPALDCFSEALEQNIKLNIVT